MHVYGGSREPRILRHVYVAAWLLGSRVRIRLRERMYLSWFVVKAEASATNWSLVGRCPAGCVCVCLIVSDLATSTLRWPRPELACWAKQNIWLYIYICMSICMYVYMYVCMCEPGSSVGIVTDYEIDGPGSNLGGDEIFRPSRPALGPTQPPVPWVPSLSLG